MARETESRQNILERGQSFVELSIGLVLFLFFVMGLLDLGRLYFVYVALEDSAGEAALYLALNANCPGPPGHATCGKVDGGCPAKCANPNNAIDRASKASGLINMNKAGASLNFEFRAATSSAEEQVHVELAYPFELITPIIRDVVGGGTITLHSEATQVLLNY